MHATCLPRFQNQNFPNFVLRAN